MGQAALRFTDVWKRFGATQALQGLEMEVPAGAMFGLIGPNGAGKTTAFSIACGFLRPDKGGITLLDVDGFDPTRLKGRLSAMPQDAALGRETKCREHLVFFGQLQGMDAREARRQSDRVLDDVGLGDRREHKTKTLSHGMLRRLAIAQALLGRPELIMLDEPTSGLDPRHAHELRDLLRRSRQGRTLVISSHNLAELESLCDHVAFIDHGVSVGGGATDTLTGKGQQIEILLAVGPVPTEAVAAALPGDQIVWDEATRVLRIMFVVDPAAPRAVEDVTGVALRALLAGSARIAEVRRGTSLEKKFLELT